jgi:hypothetical protein
MSVTIFNSLPDYLIKLIHDKNQFIGEIKFFFCSFVRIYSGEREKSNDAHFTIDMLIIREDAGTLCICLCYIHIFYNLISWSYYCAMTYL